MGTRRHFISDVDEAAAVADCAACGPRVEVLHRPDVSRWVCAVARREQRRKTGPRPSQSWRPAALMKKFGITVEDYDRMNAEQGGVCAICSQPCGTGRNLAVDHDHQTGAVRGLLCNRCNRSIGLLNDDPELLLRAAAYLND